MSVREIIHIDEDKCDGCGECVSACAEGAIQIVDGKAKLISDVYCDGLGACIGDCPQGAITIVKRQAAEYDEAAVERHLAGGKTSRPQLATAPFTCPGSAARTFGPAGQDQPAAEVPGQSQLSHWPIQLMLVPPGAPFLKGADILVCADCVPFTVPDFHARYLHGRAVLVGCPKLDDLQHYFEKLQQILAAAQPSRITVLKMEVPCCHGIAQAAEAARNAVAPKVTFEVHTIGVRGGVTVEAESAAVRKLA